MNRGPFERTPTAAELAQIEGARRALRSSARWARVAWIYVPGALGTFTFVLTLVTYPGSWLEGLLAGLGALAAIVCVLSLPLLLSKAGRPISAMRRLEQDAANGFPIVEEFGSVEWGNHGFVAATQRGPLISQRFTKFTSVPAYWYHFDGLAPGNYLFTLLPASRLVIEARPAQPPIAPVFENPVVIALLAAFRNSPEEAALNRAGRATGAQRWQLLVTHWWALLGLPFFGAAFVMALLEVIEKPALGIIFGAVVALAVLAFIAVQVAYVLLDIVDGRLESRAGRIRLTYHKADVDLNIGQSKFTTSHGRAQVFQNGRRYRVHGFKRSRIVVGADPM